LVLKRALEYLRGGGLLLTSLDAQIGNDTAELPFLGGRLTLRRGVATLARLSGAPLLPITQRWASRGARITVTVHDPIPCPSSPGETRIAFENALLAEAARWVEAYARAVPQEMCLDLLAEHWRGPDEADPLEEAPAAPRQRRAPTCAG
jgi:lauroyl/myristoyl acyltransferase